MDVRGAGTGGETRGPVVPFRRVEETIADGEADLRSAAPTLRLSRVTEESLSIGVSMAIDAECVRRAERLGIPIIRRASGGSAVLHSPGDLLFSIVLARSHPAVGRDYARAYGRLGAGLVTWLERSGVATRWAPTPKVDPELCLLSGRGETLQWRERTLGGAAQHVTRDALLHHGVVVAASPVERLSAVFGLPAERLGLHLTSLSELGVDLGTEHARVELARAMSSSLGTA
jgi:lipoate-protein ligase A